MGNEKKHPQADWIKIVSIVVVFRVSKRIGEELPRLSRWEYSQITVPITKGDQSWELFPKLCVIFPNNQKHQVIQVIQVTTWGLGLTSFTKPLASPNFIRF